ncbi:uncharacterized protein LOC144125297 isoform X2 [Amblyomma americanum]
MRRHHRRQKRAVQLFLSSPSAGCTQSDSYTSSRKPMQRSTKNNQVDELEVRLEKAAQVFLEKQGQDTSLVEISRHLQGSFDHFLITETALPTALWASASAAGGGWFETHRRTPTGKNGYKPPPARRPASSGVCAWRKLRKPCCAPSGANPVSNNSACKSGNQC